MSAYEQRIEPPDRRWQYLLLAAEPYETIAFKVSESCTSVVLFIYNSFFLLCYKLNIFALLGPE